MNQQLQQGIILSDRYTLLRELPPTYAGGSLQAGDESAVWLARDEHSGDEVSVGFLPGSSEGTRFTATGYRLEALVHPHILRTLDMGELRGHGQVDPLHYIVCSYIEGLQELSLDFNNPNETLRTLVPLLAALEFAHSLDIVHGALSRHCLVQDARGVALLSGFGSELLSVTKRTSQDHISLQVLAKQTPQVSDDIYSIGALLFFIFTGSPWVRDRTEVTNVSLVPESLRAMITSMLSDSPYDRPQTITAVIARLEEYLDPDPGKMATSIEATAFRKAELTEPATVNTAPARPGTAREQRTIPAGIALSFLAVLVLILLVVFLYQPDPIERQAVTRQDSNPGQTNTNTSRENFPQAQVIEPEGPAPYELAQLERQQDDAKILAAKLLREQIELEDLGAGLWATRELASVQAIADRGDTLFRDRQFSAAIESYNSGLKALEALRDTIPAVFAANLTKGKDALDTGEDEVAIQAFTIASRIDPTNQPAEQGLQRARNLDALRQELAAADELERSDSLPAALSAFKRALALDPVSTQAKQGVARVSAELQQRKFNETMSTGFSALQVGNFPLARQSFRDAQKLMPDSALPVDGLNQVDIADRLQQIEALQRQARQHEQAENWAAALADYEAAQRLDETLVFAQSGIQQATHRLDLQETLNNFINDPLRLRDDASLTEAKDALYQATLISTPGPLLANQITTVAQHIKLARVPIRVEFISDEQTEIMVYKVKQLGRIDRVSLELIPGNYTVVGTRKGFRDTRQEFAVQPGQTPLTITVVCSDKI